ncbi:glycosyltransferase family 9 protein [Dechloromonas denitrificans]|uniref:glycosyltransferase family 9 protein n=1 Tax=Dechloromonas denitrificans TaxID=281362 RepID=UPI001CF9256B|nr:glycosyltransferase family 9 protein [Dechloromonas denitrificans]UCV03839.1 glycosyltransferase family 9 protein [Dechloromonas denitrificans]UCV08102.1 glycosyltransferase family 9 protein [Dechloromonas denitrificans]
MKILIIRRDNIGDLICTTPLFEAIRRQYPQAYIAALVNSYNAPAIDGNPHLDAIFAYTKGKHAAGEPVWQAYLRRAKLLWQLRRMNFDYVVLASSGFAARSLKLARLLAPKHIVGFVTKKNSSARIDLAIPHGKDGPLHETEDIFRLLVPLGIAGEIPGLTVRADGDLAARLHGQLPAVVALGDGPLVALHISARKEKQRWPVERFSELAHRLHEPHAARFLVFWSPGDENNPFHPGDDGKAARLLAALSDLPVAPMRTEHLSELIAGLSLCDAAVLSDGGAMHVAAGLGKPLVCFFGNSSVERWHPWGVPYELLQKPSRDVSDISVDEAVDAFGRLLSRR